MAPRALWRQQPGSTDGPFYQPVSAATDPLGIPPGQGLWRQQKQRSGSGATPRRAADPPRRVEPRPLRAAPAPAAPLRGAPPSPPPVPPTALAPHRSPAAAPAAPAATLCSARAGSTGVDALRSLPATPLPGGRRSPPRSAGCTEPSPPPVTPPQPQPQLQRHQQPPPALPPAGVSPPFAPGLQHWELGCRPLSPPPSAQGSGGRGAAIAALERRARGILGQSDDLLARTGALGAPVTERSDASRGGSFEPEHYVLRDEHGRPLPSPAPADYATALGSGARHCGYPSVPPARSQSTSARAESHHAYGYGESDEQFGDCGDYADSTGQWRSESHGSRHLREGSPGSPPRPPHRELAPALHCDPSATASERGGDADALSDPDMRWGPAQGRGRSAEAAAPPSASPQQWADADEQFNEGQLAAPDGRSESQDRAEVDELRAEAEELRAVAGELRERNAALTADNRSLLDWNADLQHSIGELRAELGRACSERPASSSPAAEAWERRARELEGRLQDKAGMCSSLLERVRRMTREEAEQRKRHQKELDRQQALLLQAQADLAAARAGSGSPRSADDGNTAGLEAENAQLRLLCEDQRDRLAELERRLRDEADDAAALRAEGAVAGQQCAERLAEAERLHAAELAARQGELARATAERDDEIERLTAERDLVEQRTEELQGQLQALAGDVQLLRSSHQSRQSEEVDRLHRALAEAGARAAAAEDALDGERRDQEEAAAEWQRRLEEAAREAQQWRAECARLRRAVPSAAAEAEHENTGALLLLGDVLSDVLWLADVISGAARGEVDDALLMGNCEGPTEKGRRVAGAALPAVARRLADAVACAKSAAMDGLAAREGGGDESTGCVQQ